MTRPTIAQPVQKHTGACKMKKILLATATKINR